MIVLLTDFNDSWHVGIMKGVLASEAPGVPVVDLYHRLPVGGVRAGAYVLWSSVERFPPGSVFACVVDPGVGTGRRVLIARWRDRLFLAPDNGLLSVFWPEVELWAVPPSPDAHPTFHGRDVFAPLAAKLALGANPNHLGERITDPILVRVLAEEPRGEILLFDPMGNAITNIPSGFRGDYVRVKGVKVPVARTFGDVPRGHLLAYPGSGGTWEIGVNMGRAQEFLSIGEEVELV